MTAPTRLHLTTDGARLPDRVVAGAATLPVLVSGGGDPGASSGVLVVTGDLPAAIDSDAVLLVDPEPTLMVTSTASGPVVVVSRWATSDTTAAFASTFATHLQATKFVHVRATVPTGTAPGTALLNTVLLLHRVFGAGLGTVQHFSATDRRILVIGSTSAGDGPPRETHVSIVLTDAGIPEARLDAYGDGAVCTLVVPDRDAGSAPSTAYLVTDDGLQSLPTLFADPIRSALLRLASALNTGTTTDDLNRLRAATAEVAPLLAATA